MQQQLTKKLYVSDVHIQVKYKVKHEKTFK